MGITEKLFDAMKGMMELNAEVRQLSKRVDKLDDQSNIHLQRISRLETFVEIAEKHKKLT